MSGLKYILSVGCGLIVTGVTILTLEMYDKYRDEGQETTPVNVENSYFDNAPVYINSYEDETDSDEDSNEIIIEEEIIKS